MAIINGSNNKDGLNGTADNDTFANILGADILNGLAGSDTFEFSVSPTAGATIDGGTGDGISDASVDIPSGDAESGKGNTLTAKVTYSQSDILNITNSLDLSALEFSHIEKIQLQDGVELTMTSEQFIEDLESLTYTKGSSEFNPGLQVAGLAGGKTEKLTIVVEKDADFQLDDASTGYMFKDLDVTIKFTGGNVRYDGTAGDETILGGDGTEYITPRLGNDIVRAGAGNDLLIGHEGADKLYGEDGDDIFLLARLATKAGGGTFTVSKASDGTAELVSGDLMDGGIGVDELRITATGANISATENTVVLTPDNFQNIEKVTIGTTIAKDAKYAAVQDQMAAGAYTAVTTGTDKINVNGAALTTGVTYAGNNGDNVITGGSANDIIHANGGNDVLSGGKGNDVLDGGEGIDSLVLDPASLANIKVYLTSNLQTVLANSATGERDTFSSIEKALIGTQSVDVGFLAQAGGQLKNIGLVDKLLFNKAPGIEDLINLSAVANNPQSLIDKVLSSTAAQQSLGGLDNRQFATTIVNNGLGINDQNTIKVAEDYLSNHSRAELVLIGIQFQPVVDHAFAGDGLQLL